MSALMTGVSLAFSSGFVLVGCASLALGQHRHWRTVTGTKLHKSSQTVIRLTGWALIFAALVLCIVRDGASFASLTWPLLITAGACAVAMTLSFNAVWLRPLAIFYSSLTQNR